MNTLDLFMSGQAARVAAANVAARESARTPERSSGPSGSGAPPQPPMPGFPPAGAATPVPAAAALPRPAPNAVPLPRHIKLATGRAPAAVAIGPGTGNAQDIQPTTVVAVHASTDTDTLDDALAGVDVADESALDIVVTDAVVVHETNADDAAVNDVDAPQGDDAAPADDADAPQGDDGAPGDDADASQVDDADVSQGDDAAPGDDLDDIQPPAKSQKPNSATIVVSGVAALSKGPLSISLVSAATDAPGHARHFLVSLRAHNDPGAPLCAAMHVSDWRSAADIGTALSTVLAPLISEYIALLPARQLDAAKQAVVKPTAPALKPPSKPPATPARPVSKMPAAKSPAAKAVKPVKAAPLDALTLF